MDRLVVRLLRLLGQRLGWARMLFVVQDETGKVAWSVTPDDLPLSVRVNTDYSLSLTLGHRDPGDAFLAELETLTAAHTARKPPVWRLLSFLALRTPGAHPGLRFAPRCAVRSRGRR